MALVKDPRSPSWLQFDDSKVTIVGLDDIERFALASPVAGTRFTLARPQGGREGAEKAPLLAEDQLIMQRGNHSRPKKKDSSVDPFAAEYSDDTWHTTNRVNLPKGHLGNSAILGMGSASRNPNERRSVARRRH